MRHVASVKSLAAGLTLFFAILLIPSGVFAQEAAGAPADSGIDPAALIQQVQSALPQSASSTSSGTTAPNPNAGVSLNIGFNTGQQGDDYSVAIQLLVFMTLLTLAPSIIMLMTCFTRIVIVLGFVGRAIGTTGIPSNQIIVGISLFLTFFIMGPTWNKIHDEAVVPYQQHEITSGAAFDIASGHMKAFMLRQTSANDIEFFLGLANMGPTAVRDIPMRVVIPSFILSELRRAFEMGFLIFVPFLIIDFIVASTLMSMGMMMMPPVVISLPFKILLFVLVDGWTLVVKSLVLSFNM
ncbi:MAG TPA: flagellar type III secretion system pore protein FliP [Opitutales bacterium]|nr:flagellar type III secretion system pore protein FliP [Opitutales bacterium]